MDTEWWHSIMGRNEAGRAQNSSTGAVIKRTIDFHSRCWPLVISKRTIIFDCVTLRFVVENFFTPMNLLFFHVISINICCPLRIDFLKIYRNHKPRRENRCNNVRTMLKSKMHSRNLINNVEKAIVLMAHRASEIKD